MKDHNEIVEEKKQTQEEELQTKEETKQTTELEELNTVMLINTVATVGSFIFSMVMAYLLWGK